MKASGRSAWKPIWFVCMIAAWELVARCELYPPLLFPSVTDILKALGRELACLDIVRRSWWSLSLIGAGIGIAMPLAIGAAGLAVTSRRASEIVTLLMAVLHPLPGIAILPIFLLWFGTGSRSIEAIIIFSALWPLLSNIYQGIRSVPKVQLEAAQNLGFRGARLVLGVMVPAAFPYLLSGLRVAWARAWQASVAAEMVFGAGGGEGGLGWFLYKKRFFMEIPEVFAGMIVIILIGITVEHLVFERVERRTIRKWGMSVT